MNFDPLLVQRFQSSVARLEPAFDRVTRGFFARLGRDCPHVARLVPEWTPRGRFEMATVVAGIVRNPERAGGFLLGTRRAFARAGVTEQDLRIMQKALMHEVELAAGGAWSEEDRADWSAVLHGVFVDLGPRAQQRVRSAA